MKRLNTHNGRRLRVAVVGEKPASLVTLDATSPSVEGASFEVLSECLRNQGVDVDVHLRPEDACVEAEPFAEELLESWERDRPDVVHALSWTSGHASMWAARRLGLPMVQSFDDLATVELRHHEHRHGEHRHGEHRHGPAKKRLDVEHSLAHDADRLVVACSEQVFELVRMGAERRRIAVVPRGVDLQRFSPDGEVEPATPGRHRLVAVGGVAEHTGIADVVAALTQLPTAELIVVASGDLCHGSEESRERRRLEAVAKAVGVAERVEFRTFTELPVLPALLRSADAVVCVPWYDSRGAAVAEAMACGVPPVVSCVGGLVEVVVDGVSGLCVPPRSPLLLAEALHGLLADARVRRWVGGAGARRVRQHHGWPRVAQARARVYAQVAGIATEPVAAQRGR